MRRLSIARSLQLALLGLTVALTAIAALGVGALYQSRQDYEDRLAEGLQLQASAGRLLAAGVVEEATLRLRRGPDGLTERRRARAAYRAANREALALAQGDAARRSPPRPPASSSCACARPRRPRRWPPASRWPGSAAVRRSGSRTPATRRRARHAGP
ncbi:hypothetical protein [Paraconexibacter algicola]|uniref:hypothetical protein n=1 Tax=Paraconexibacter algicola TaxID=2133960 RepID=UPI0013049C01|nr:hypothetical protein [Paraconexibacter algicola]